MRRLLVVFLIPASVLAGIILLFTLFNASPASAFPSSSHESGRAAIDPGAAIIPVSEPIIDPAGSLAPESRPAAAPVAGLIKPEADLNIVAAPLASLFIEANYADDWVAGNADAGAPVMVTVTDVANDPIETATVSADGTTGDFYVGCDDWDSGNCPDINPGDKVVASIVGATAEIDPVGTITGKMNTTSEVITGTLNAGWLPDPTDVQCEIWEVDGPTIATTADPDGGQFVCDFGGLWDLQRGDQVALRYNESDGDSVINILPWPFTNVNYAHDWAQLTYELGREVTIYIQDESLQLKAQAFGETSSYDGWGGPGFWATNWWPPNPDIVPGDLVIFYTDDGYANSVVVGDISGAIDIDNDNITGDVSANFPVSLTVDCAPWGAWEQGIDAPGRSDLVLPDGLDTYLCQWDPGTEWNVIPGQPIAVNYWEPDGDSVMSAFDEPAPYLRIWKDISGSPGVSGNQLFRISYRNDGDGPAENVLITDTFSAGFSYLSDTSGISHSGGASGPIVWNLGTVDSGVESFFDVYFEVTGSQDDPVSNSADIGTTNPYDQGDPGEKHAEWNGHIQANDTHLNVDVSPLTGDPAPGEDFIYGVNVCNNGSTASTEVTLDENLQIITVLQGWTAQDPGWHETYSDQAHLIVSNPSIPGHTCSEVQVRVNLDSGVEPGQYLINVATITATNDLETNDNVSTWEGNAGSPHTNLWILKNWDRGSLVPGGELNYSVQYANNGNIPVGSILITDTLPEGTVFVSAWHNDSYGSYDFVPIYLDSDIVVWEIPGLENGFGGDFNVNLAIDPAATPGSPLVNQVDITSLPGEDDYGDNTAQWVEELYPPGPNLRVFKNHNWNGDGRLDYNVYFENVGDETISDLWITDTLPAGTTWDGWWNADWDWSRFITFTHDSGLLKWHYVDFYPQDSARISFNANLDEPGVPLRWFNNLVETTIPLGDPSPGDNDWEDVAFSGGEVRRVELWINQNSDSNIWGEAVPGYPITVTMPHGQYFAWADPACDGCWNIDNVGFITPGITIIVEAGPANQPITIMVPDPLEANADSSTEEVSGQIGGWFNQNVEIHGDFGYQDVSTDGAGNFLAVYDDIPRGGSGYIRFVNQVDYAEVIYHRPLYTLDVVLEINYGHDWVEGYYEPGHTVWITVTESDGSTVKGQAELYSGHVPWWDGETGFSINWHGWLGNGPDMQPGDWVYAMVDNGYSNVTQIGDIDFTVDIGTDLVYGNLTAGLFVDPLQLRCELWDHPDNPAIDDLVNPASGPIYCDFGTAGYPIDHGQSVGVMYWEPDSDRIINTFDWLQLRGEIGPASDGDRHVWGHYAGANATVTVTVETEGGAPVAETTLQADAGGNFDAEQDLPEGSLGFWNWVKVSSSSGITAAMQIYPMGGEAFVDTDVISVTAAGPPFFNINLQYCEPGWCDSYDMGNIGAGGIVTANLMSERGFDVRPGTNYYATLDTWDGHTVNYVWELPAPDLGVWKWNTNGHARPDGFVVYNIQYQNNGNGPAENVTIVDTLPDYLSYYDDTSGLPVTIGAGNMITWELGTVPEGENERFVVVLHVDPGAPNGSVVIGENCADIYTTTEGDSNPDDNGQCTGPVDVWDNDVDLSVSKNANPNDPTPGQEFDYNINWCNNRGAAAGPVVLTDTLPAGVSLIGWWPSDDPYWSELSYDGTELVLYAPALPGDMCDNIYLRVLLDEAVPLGASLENLVVLDVAGDVYPDDNWHLDSNTYASPPRYDLQVAKTLNNGVWAPGGFIGFSIDWGNQGNITTTVRVTDTLPPGLSYARGWWAGYTPWPDDPLPEPTVVGNQLVWDFPELPVGNGHGINFELNIDGAVDPDPSLENCATIAGDGPDDTPYNNESCLFFPVNPAGPNLQVDKWHYWNGDGQLNYRINFRNIGDVTVNDVWLVDTLPAGTHWNGWWNMNFDWSRFIDDIVEDNGQLRWHFSDLQPGDWGEIDYQVNLDDPGQPLVWYTNIVTITEPPGDSDPGDNYFEDVAFSGGEVQYVELDVHGNHIWGYAPQGPIVITTPYEEDILPWDGDFDWNLDNNLLPGDVVTITAGAGVAPVTILIPNPFDAIGSSLTDEVTGQVDHLDNEWLEVYLNNGPVVQVQTDNSGNFSVSFPDIPRGGEGEVLYYTEVDYTDITFHRRWRSQDLMLSVEYKRDSVESWYELGHTLWITVTESDGVTVKATAETTSQYVPPWNDFGFTTSDDDWTPSRPDIQPGDWVYGRVDNGYTTTLQVFTVNGVVDVDNDHLTGSLDAPWYVGVVDFLDVQCHPWGAWNQGWNDVQVKNSQASPDGVVPYFCGWDPGTEWDIDYGQEISVWVMNPDGNQVVNVFEGEAVEMAVWKWQQGNYARPGGVVVYGHYYQNNGSVPAENVQISDELPPFTSYVADTSPYAVTVGPGQAVTWDLGTVEPGQDGYIWVTLDVSPTAPTGPGVIEPNCATISTSTAPELDPSNDANCANPVDIWEDEVELDLQKWTDPHDPTPGQEFIYNLQWCNNRGAAAGPAWLTDTLPVGATLIEWREQDDWLNLWYEVSFDGTELTLYAPGLPGDECQQIELLMLLNPEVSLGEVLRNTAILQVADDVDQGNNYVEHDLHASPPRYDLQINKRFHNGELYPGGTFNYFIDYYNNGNTVTGVVITETVPAGLIYNQAWWGGGQENAEQPLPDPAIIGDQLIWTLDEISINHSRWFHVEFTIDPNTIPGTEFGNCVEIAGDGPDDTPGNNTACETITVNPTGPNLRVFKESWWNNNNQDLQYQITFLNVGDETFFDVAITDTLPTGVSLMNEPWNDYWNQVDNIDLGGNVWQFIVEEINPGAMGRIYFDVSLDEPWLRPVWYTNLVEIDIPPGDVDPDDNNDEDVAFTGGELSRVEFWLDPSGQSGMWGEAVPGTTITITTAHDQFNAWADPGCGGCWGIDDTGLIEPDDTIEIIAGAGIIPVVVTIPDPLTAEVDTGTGEVSGQIGGWNERLVEVHGQWPGGYQEVTSDGAGNFLAAYGNMPRGAYGYIRFSDEVDYAEVIYHRPFNSLDLVLDVNYGHDWVEGLYEAGHTIWITITESDGTTVKGLAELYSDPIPDWGGQSGFSPNYYGGWLGDQPDLLPGDWVFGQVDNGYTSTARIGTITGELDVGADTISGTITADWLDDPLAAACGVWVQDGPSIDMMVDPHGGSYFCDFTPTGWDITPGQDVGVSYWEPDGDRINNVFTEPAPHLWINKIGRTEAGEGGRMLFYISYQNDGDAPAEDVVITDTMSANLSYLYDTSGFPLTGDGSGPLTWEVGTVDPGQSGFFMLFAEVLGLESEPVSNMATIATSNPYDQGDPGEKDAGWEGTIQANDVHLNVDKYSWTPDPAPGENFTFEINVCNNGNTGSTELLITDYFHPDITLVDWSTVYEDIYEVERAVDHLTIGRYSAPGNWCGQIYIEAHLDDGVQPGATLTNTVTIAADNDIETDDNSATWEGQAGEPHINLRVYKWFDWGQLVPGGQTVYHVSIQNTGNLPVGPFVLTDSLPLDATFLESWTDEGFYAQDLPPNWFDDDFAVWEFAGLENGHSIELSILLEIDPLATPGAILSNTAELTHLPGEDDYEDNSSTAIEEIFPPGPNLRVRKWHDWQSPDHLQYNIRVENIGTTHVDQLWLTDTLPVDTTWDGWWDTSFGGEQQLDFTPEADSLTWHFADLGPGEMNFVYIGVDRDFGSPALVYTNTVNIVGPPDDVNPDDNEFIDVAHVSLDEGQLWISPTLSQVQVDGTVTVDVMVNGIADLYGVSLEIIFDPAALEVVDADGGEPGVQIEPGDCPVASLVINNEADNGAGVINYDVGSLNPAPPCDGGGLMARITFRALAPGAHGVIFSDWLLSNTLPQAIPVIAADGEIEVTELGLIQGAVELQSRFDHSGAEVCANGGGGNITCTTTDAAGNYELWLAGGTYTVTAEMGSYLDGEKSGVAVPAGGSTALSPVKLLGGDITNDCLVNILDLAFMGARFGYSLGDPSFDSRADINNDGTINILDISVSGGNYQKRCPVPWLPWEFVTVPGLPEGAVPVNLYAEAPDNLYVWFELNHADPLTRTAELAHWDGASWTMVLSYPGYTQGRIHGNGPDDIFVSASCSAADCTGYETPHLAHFDGATWQEQTVPPEVGSYILEISGAPGEVQAATFGNPDTASRIIIRYDDGTEQWSYLYTPPEGIKALYFLSAGEGYFTTCWGHGRWDGAAWSYKHEFDFCDLAAAWGMRDGADDLHLYTVGKNNFSNGVRVWKYTEDANPALLGTFGSKCGFVFGDPTDGGYICGGLDHIGGASGVWGAAANDVYVVGLLGAGTDPDSGRIYHYDGASWYHATEMGDIPQVYKVGGSGANDVWFTLRDGQLLHHGS